MSAVNAAALLAAAGGDYQISRSVRLRSSASAYFNRTPASAGNQKTWTWSGWVKLGNMADCALFQAYSDVNNRTQIGIGANTINWTELEAGSTTGRLNTSAVYRDPSAWYHVVCAVDTTQATASNRMKMYVNGQPITSFAVATYPPQNANWFVNGVYAHYLGRDVAGAASLDGYLTEINFIDGQALTPSSFGETDAVTGVWKPKKYAGTYGTNGFYLNFSDNSAATAAAIGKDYSGNGNNWTPNNISVTAGVTYDSMLDVPTMWADGGNGRGNYCTLNPLMQRWAVNASVFSNANLSVSSSNASTAFAFGTQAVSSGKWYWEATMTAAGTATPAVGVATIEAQATVETNTVIYAKNGNKYVGGSFTAYGASYTTNDVIGVALDCDAGTVTFYKNNASQGAITLVTSANLLPHIQNITNSAFAVNFGQRPFAYTPPTGFKALNTQNLPDATIKKGNAYFDVVLAAGASIKTSAEALFTGDELVWIKDRANVNNHQLIDTVRGTSAVLQSNTTAAETTYTAPSGNSVGWVWKESASAGFDIVTCTTNGSGIITSTSHNLGVTPSMIILKARTGTDAWYVYHKNSTTTATQGTLQLNATAAVNTTNGSSGGVDKWTVSSSAFAAGNAAWSYQANTNHIAYLFAEVASFSKFGSYTGNGSADGPFVYCGFRPRFVMIKKTDTAGDSWFVFDTAREQFNVQGNWLAPNLSNAEATNTFADILSNGFKLRGSISAFNGSGGTYVFAAFAENPFKNSLAR